MSGSGFEVVDYADEMETTMPVALAVVDIIGEASCVCLPGMTATRVDSTHFLVTFDAPVYALPTLSYVGAYAFDPPLEVLSVAFGTVTEAGEYDTVTEVTLTTAEQGPETYTLRVYGVELA